MTGIAAIVLALGLKTPPVGAHYNIECEQGDYLATVSVYDGTAKVEMCNTDWSCFQSTSEIFAFAEKQSDGRFARFVDGNSRVRLEISSEPQKDNSVEVILDGQKDFRCHLIK